MGKTWKDKKKWDKKQQNDKPIKKVPTEKNKNNKEYNTRISSFEWYEVDDN